MAKLGEQTTLAGTGTPDKPRRNGGTETREAGWEGSKSADASVQGHAGPRDAAKRQPRQ